VVSDVRKALPELPAARRRRFAESYGLTASDAALLTSERSLADYFESVAGAGATAEQARPTANWIVNDVLGLQRERGLPHDQLPVSAEQLKELIRLVAGGALTLRAAKELLPQIGSEEPARAAAERANLLALDDDDALRTAAQESIAAFPDAVADYKRGKTAAIGRLIGETIKRTGGRANPDAVRRLLVAELTSE
jgi:aspartyl-tRNA(Asn)/glutamyl-tRNA(Gln) amidotransferase subunit B